jgi:hypothetical protein
VAFKIINNEVITDGSVLTNTTIDTSNVLDNVFTITDGLNSTQVNRGDTVTFVGSGSTTVTESSGIVTINTSVISSEDIQDAVALLFEHSNHTNITATYDDPGNEIILVAPTNISTFINDAGYLATSGGTMTGTLTLYGDPTTNNEAATKIYVDNAVSSGSSSLNSDDITEGSTNLYYTDSRARSSISATGDISYNPTTGVISFTERTDAEVRGLISHVDNGGDGSLSYNSTNGVITYTGPSTTEVRAHFTGGTGVTITSGSIDIGQEVSTSSDVTFNDVQVSGDLTVSGTTTTVNTETINLADNIILLNSNATGSATENSGIEIERGSDANKTLIWDETTDKWTVGSETFVAATFEGNLTGTVSDISNHDTDDLSEGSTNLYYTTTRANTDFDTRLATKDTDNLSEGSTNQYYTDSRARSSISASGDLSYNSTTGEISFTASGSPVTSVNTQTGSVVLDTDDIAEGSTNLYYTTTRANSAIDTRVNKAFVDALNIQAASVDTNSVALGTDTTGNYMSGISGTANQIQVTHTPAEGSSATIGLTDDVTISNDLVVSGDLTVNGTTTTVLSSSTRINENLLYLNEGGEATITNAVGNGSTVTYTADNTFSIGYTVDITGISPTSFNVTDATITAADSTSFTISSTVTDTYVSGGEAHGHAHVNVDLGWAGAYDDGTYHHAGFFRDASDGRFKAFDSYVPEPSDSINIDTNHASFALANIQADTFIGDLTGTVSDISNHDTDNLTEGSTNLYYTTTRANTDFDTRLATKDTDNLSEGSTNLYYTDSRARSSISASGDLSYNSTTGEISFTASGSPVTSVNTQTGSVVLDTDDIAEGSTNLYYTTTRANSAIDTRVNKAFVDALNIQAASVDTNSVALGTDTTGNYMSGISGTANQIQVTHTPAEGSSATIGLTDDVTISNDLVVSGDLTVSGTTTTVNTETINLADNIILLNSNATGTPSENSGIEVERGSSTNVDLRFNESNDRWQFTNDGSTHYNIPVPSEYTSYTHPTHPGDDFSVDTGALTGATVVSDIDINVTTDTLGHVTDANGTVSTRTITAANVGALPITGGELTGDLGIGEDEDNFYTKLVVGDLAGADEGIQIASSTTGKGSLLFADGGGYVGGGSTPNFTQYRGWLRYDHNTDKMDIATAGGPRLTIDSSGNTTITGIMTANGTSSSSAPKYTFNGDNNTGLGYIGSDAVGLIAGGSRKFYVSGTTAYFQNLSGGVDISGDLTVSGTVDGRDVSVDGAKLDTIDTNANYYIHPTHPGDDIDIDTTPLTGATVISDLDFNVTTDTLGHVTDANGIVQTRTLTLADLGYTGVTGADNYGGWDLWVEGTDRGVISSSENVKFVGGTNVSLSYSTTGDNTITINSTGGSGGATELDDLSDAQTGTGTNCIGIGNGAQDSITSGNASIAIGAYAQANQTNVGTANNTLGYLSMANATGNYNNAFGYFAMKGTTTGNSNSAFGHSALSGSGAKTGNSAFGSNALIDVTTGEYNIGIGYEAGDDITTGSNNTIIGRLAGSTSLSSTVLIGAGDTERLKINSTGLYVNGSATPLTNYSLPLATDYTRGGIELFSDTDQTVAANSVTTTAGRTYGIQLNSNDQAVVNVPWTDTGATSLNDLDDATDTVGASFNLGIGNNALELLTGGSYNLAVGTSAMQNVTGGSSNCAVGQLALTDSSGNYNTAVGRSAAKDLSGGNENVAIGYNALYTSGSKSKNAAVGTNSLLSLTTGEYNIGLGNDAGEDITTGSNNTVIGTLAGSSSLSSTVLIGAGSTERLKIDSTGLYVNGSTTALEGGATSIDDLSDARSFLSLASYGLGGDALNASMTGGANTAVGGGTLTQITSGYNNTAVGVSALRLNTTGTDSTGLGQQALYDQTTGHGNTAVGKESLSGVTTGQNNIGIGKKAGELITTGENNTVIGDLNGTSTMTSTVLIGAGITERLKIDHTGLYVNGSTTALVGGASDIDGLSDATSYGTFNNGLGAFSLTSLTTGTYNTAVGERSLNQNTEGNENVAVGTHALYGNTEGSYNSAVGHQTLYSNTTGENNVAFGNKALNSNTTGNNNTASGFQSMLSNTTGSYNLASGYRALYSNTTGSYNTAIGYQSLTSSTAQFNTAIGYQSLSSSTSGASNAAFGFNALKSNTTGHRNTACGYETLWANTTGTNNTASGWRSLQNNTNGYDNTATGHFSLRSNTSGRLISAFGQESLQANTTGEFNSGFGAASLKNLTTGSHNLGLGRNAGYSITTGSSNTIIGSLNGTSTMASTVLIGAGSTERLKIDSTGLYVNGSSTALAGGATDIDGLSDGKTNGYGIGLGGGALENITTTNSNIAIGHNAQHTATSAAGNVAIGNSAAYANLYGGANVAIGDESLKDCTGSGGVSIGYAACSNYEGGHITGVGKVALHACTTGYGNTGLGYEVGRYITTGSDNTTVGYQAGTALTTGSNNTIIGRLSGGSATLSGTVLIGAGTTERLKVDSTGLYVNGSSTALAGGATDIDGLSDGYYDGNSVGLGSGALANDDGTNNANVAVGVTALNNATTAQNNAAVGYQALYQTTTGESNSAVGAQALLSNTTGGYGSALGWYSLKNNTTGFENTSVGQQSLRLNTTGSWNTSVGANNNRSNITGNYNASLGYKALYYNTDSQNSAFGTYASRNNSTGTNNTTLGYNAGEAITTGGSNTVLGSLSGTSTMASTVLIGAGTTERLKVNSTGLYINGSAKRLSLDSSGGDIDGNFIATGDMGIGGSPVTGASGSTTTHIKGTSSGAYLRLTTDTAGHTASDGLDILVGGGTNPDAYIWHRESGPMKFGTNNAERMVIDSIGNVGIGTGATSLSEKLEVSGTVKATAFVGDGSGLTGISPPLPLVKTTNYTATSGDIVVAGAGGITITLPSSPSVGDSVIVKDGTGAVSTTSFTVARNGSNIASSGSDLTFDQDWKEIRMVYINSTIGWSV